MPSVKIPLYLFFFLVLGLLGWRMYSLLNPKEKASKAPIAAPVEKKNSEVQEWIRNRDLLEKRNQQHVHTPVED